MRVRVDELVADFTGEEDVGAHAELVPESLVAHGLPQVPQAEDRGQSHQAVRVVSRFGCHVGPFLPGSDYRRQNEDLKEDDHSMRGRPENPLPESASRGQKSEKFPKSSGKMFQYLQKSHNEKLKWLLAE